MDRAKPSVDIANNVSSSSMVSGGAQIPRSRLIFGREYEDWKNGPVDILASYLSILCSWVRSSLNFQVSFMVESQPPTLPSCSPRTQLPATRNPFVMTQSAEPSAF